MIETWVRLYNSRWPIAGGAPGLGWAMWQPGYSATQWPHDELEPDFAYYVCESQPDGCRAITYRAKATHVLPPTKAATPEEAYDLMAEHIFDNDLRVAPDVWHDYHYNMLKAEAPWPQQIVAWRAEVVPIGPHVLAALQSFPRGGWLKTDVIAL